MRIIVVLYRISEVLECIVPARLYPVTIKIAQQISRYVFLHDPSSSRCARNAHRRAMDRYRSTCAPVKPGLGRVWKINPRNVTNHKETLDLLSIYGTAFQIYRDQWSLYISRYLKNIKVLPRKNCFPPWSTRKYILFRVSSVFFLFHLSQRLWKVRKRLIFFHVVCR